MLRFAETQTVKPFVTLIYRNITNTSSHLIDRSENITMANRYDSVEKKFGISAYASPHEGFAAVVKARYSDFIVHEGE